jgi:serine protease
MSSTRWIGRAIIMGAFAAMAGCATAEDDSLTDANLRVGPNQTRVVIGYKPGAKASAKAALGNAKAAIHHELDHLGAIAATMPAAALNGLANNPNIEYVEEDAIRTPMAASPGEVPTYGLKQVQAPQMHAAQQTGAGAKVCIIDSGLKIWGNEPAPGASPITYAPGNLPANQDGSGHGTHVANTVAGKNGIGVAPDAELVIVRVFGDDGTWTYASSLAAAAQECVVAGADIVSMSLGGARKNRAEQKQFDTMLSTASNGGKGILSFAAASNDGNRTTSYPAGYASVVSVAAIDSNKVRATFSNYNRDVELAAAGVGVVSQVPYQAINEVSVEGTIYSGGAFDNSPEGSASGPIVDGGLCNVAVAAGTYTGKVVHCQRGEVAFADKVKNAADGGAEAVVVSNNVDGPFSGTLGTYTSPVVAITVSKADGAALTVGATATVTSTLDEEKNGFEPYNGTSMATPHASGVAALVLGACPSASAAQLRDAMNSTAEDLGAAGRDVNYGYGLVRACSAANSLCNANISCTP